SSVPVVSRLTLCARNSGETGSDVSLSRREHATGRAPQNEEGGGGAAPITRSRLFNSAGAASRDDRAASSSTRSPEWTIPWRLLTCILYAVQNSCSWMAEPVRPFHRSRVGSSTSAKLLT